MAKNTKLKSHQLSTSKYKRHPKKVVSPSHQALHFLFENFMMCTKMCTIFNGNGNTSFGLEISHKSLAMNEALMMPQFPAKMCVHKSFYWQR